MNPFENTCLHTDVISENDLNKSYLKQPGACSSLSYLPLSI